MTVPRFLLALIMLYILAFKLDAQNFGTFFSAQYGGAPWSWAKFVDLVQHVWPVVLIATFGGLAYNMRVMRANLLDTLNAQYIETARAKGLTEVGRHHASHAVPNALHPLIAYQGVVLPYMLTGEIEVAIVFCARDRRPGDRRLRWPPATSTSPRPSCWCWRRRCIVGNIIADILLSRPRSAHPSRGARGMTDHVSDSPTAQPVSAADAAPTVPSRRRSATRSGSWRRATAPLSGAASVVRPWA